MNFIWLTGIFLIRLSCQLSAQENSNCCKNEIKAINATLLQVVSGMERVVEQIINMKGVLQSVEIKLDSNKRKIDSFEQRITRIHDICSSKEEILSRKPEEKLSDKLDEYGNKLLTEHHISRNYTRHQIEVLIDVKNITISALGKMHTRLDTLVTSDQTERELSGLSKTIEKLSNKTYHHEAQLGRLKDTLDFIERTVNSLDDYTKVQIPELWANFSKVIGDQRGDISGITAFRINDAADKTKILKDELSSLLDVEMKLLQVTKLSEDITRKLKHGTVSKDSLLTLANSLLLSLEDIKAGFPSKISHLTEVINSIEINLLHLKNRTKSDNSFTCITDIVNDVKNNYKDIIKYLNNTQTNIKRPITAATNLNEYALSEMLNRVMEKLGDIQDILTSNKNALGNLKYVSDEIKENQVALQNLKTDEDDYDDDKTLG